GMATKATDVAPQTVDGATTALADELAAAASIDLLAAADILLSVARQHPRFEPQLQALSGGGGATGVGATLRAVHVVRVVWLVTGVDEARARHEAARLLRAHSPTQLVGESLENYAARVAAERAAVGLAAPMAMDLVAG